MVARCARKPTPYEAARHRRWRNQFFLRHPEEAERRLRLEDCFTDDLERALRNQEANTFAGLWIQNQPEYRFVVPITRDGEETIRPYLKDESEQFRRLIE